MGYDLSVTKHYPIEAVVIIDHGLGLFTLYGHTSSIDVKAGDHLHYGVYLDGVAILHVEWWDPKWIADNIDPKLEGRSGEEIAQSQQPQRVARHKRRR